MTNCSSQTSCIFNRTLQKDSVDLLWSVILTERAAGNMKKVTALINQMSISKLKFHQSSLTPLEAFSKPHNSFGASHRGRIPPSANKVQVHGVCTQERVSLQASQSSHEQQLQLATVNILAEDAVFMCLVGVRLSSRRDTSSMKMLLFGLPICWYRVDWVETPERSCGLENATRCCQL